MIVFTPKLMSSITQVVNLVESKLNTLLENYNFLKEENQLLLSKITKLEQQLVEEQQLKEGVLEEFKTLKIAKTIEGSKDNSRDTKLKINALIREIDACIAQLSE